MDKREILKLSPKERDILFIWKFLFFPSNLDTEQIAKYSKYTKEEVNDFINKFNHSYRIKLECYEQEREIKNAVGDILCGRSWKAYKKSNDRLTSRFFIANA